MNTIDFISAAPFFNGLSPENKQALASLSRIKRVQKKQILFIEQEKGHALFLLISGNIRLFKSLPDGKEIVIRIIEPGEVFGEVILFEEDVYPVSAMAIKDSTLLLLPKREIDTLLEKASFRKDFIRMLMRKMRYLAEQIREWSSNDPESRFIRFLESHYGLRSDYPVAFSKKEVAASIGILPETFSRLLLRLKKSGRAEWGPTSIRIHRLPN